MIVYPVPLVCTKNCHQRHDNIIPDNVYLPFILNVFFGSFHLTSVSFPLSCFGVTGRVIQSYSMSKCFARKVIDWQILPIDGRVTRGVGAVCTDKSRSTSEEVCEDGWYVQVYGGCCRRCCPVLCKRCRRRSVPSFKRLLCSSSKLRCTCTKLCSSCCMCT